MRKSKKVLAVLMAAAMTVSSFAGVPGNGRSAEAAAKKGVKLNKTAVSLVKGKKVTLKVKASKGIKIKSCKWSSKKKTIASVSKKGIVQAKKKGKTVITATVKYRKSKKAKVQTKKLTCKITVTNKKAKATAAPKVTPKVTPKASASVTSAPVTSAAVSTKTPVTSATVPTNTPAAGAETPAVPTNTPVVPTQTPFVSEDPIIIPTDDPDATPVPEPLITTIPSQGKSKGGVTKYDDGTMDKDLTATALIQKMGQGWNLGNTLESCGIDTGDKDPNSVSTDVYETGWGQPKTTKKLITSVRQCGFKTIRIPVAWSNMISDDGNYTINDKYLKRVETVMNYCFENDMYVVLNIHYDGGWWGMFGAADENGNDRQDVRDEAWKKYRAIWTQLAERYGEYGDRLIFESANEELSDLVGGSNKGLNTAYEGVEGNLTHDQAYEVSNEINQEFVKIIRDSASKEGCENNKYRQLLLAGFATDIDKTCDDRWVMPTDPVEENGKTKLSVSVHYYSPYGYALCEDKTDPLYRDKWGTQADYDYLHGQFDKLKKFSDQGYGIIIGEYGFGSVDKKNVPQFVKEIMTYGPKVGAAPILWNNSVFERNDKVLCFRDFGEMMTKVTGVVNIPLEDGAVNTGTALLEKLSDEEAAQLKVVATWEGTWTRTNNKGITSDGKPDLALGEVGKFETTSCSDDLTMWSNPYFWQLFLTYDWSKLKKPCIRVTMAADEKSSQADFQFAYCKGTKEGEGATYFNAMDHSTYDSAVLALNGEKLASVKKWIEFSSPTEGASISKIEILDLAD